MVEAAKVRDAASLWLHPLFLSYCFDFRQLLGPRRGINLTTRLNGYIKRSFSRIVGNPGDKGISCNWEQEVEEL
jgi:hypothetical protein